MADLTIDEVRDIGTTATRRVIGDPFSHVEADAEQDWRDREAEWRAASDLAVRLVTTIIEDLRERGDARFPRRSTAFEWKLDLGTRCCSRVNSWV